MHFNYLIIFCRSTVGKKSLFSIYGASMWPSEKIPFPIYGAFAHACCHRPTDRKKSSEKILEKNPRTHACWRQAVRSEKILFPIYGMFAHALCRISRTKSSPPSASVWLGVPRFASRGATFLWLARHTRSDKIPFSQFRCFKPNLMVCWRKSN